MKNKQAKENINHGKACPYIEIHPSKKQIADYKHHISDINIMKNKACLLFVTKHNELNTEMTEEKRV